MAAFMGGNDEKSASDGESYSRDEWVREADPVEVELAAFHEEFDDGGLGTLKLP